MNRGTNLIHNIPNKLLPDRRSQSFHQTLRTRLNKVAVLLFHVFNPKIVQSLDRITVQAGDAELRVGLAVVDCDLTSVEGETVVEITVVTIIHVDRWVLLRQGVTSESDTHRHWQRRE